jgi:hypothetical protein
MMTQNQFKDIIYRICDDLTKGDAFSATFNTFNPALFERFKPKYV